MERGRVDLHLVDERQLELILRCSKRPQRRLPEQHRRTRLPRRALVLPDCESAGDRKRLEAALLEVLLRLVVDRPDPAEIPLALLRVGEERRHLDRPPLQERGDRLHIRLCKVERALPQVAVSEEVVPATEVDQRRRPLLGRLLHQLHAALREALDLRRKGDILECPFLRRGRHRPPSPGCEG